jgi:hypothetical protein
LPLIEFGRGLRKARVCGQQLLNHGYVIRFCSFLLEQFDYFVDISLICHSTRLNGAVCSNQSSIKAGRGASGAVGAEAPV